MNGAPDPLSDLRDIHLPDPVSVWPPAPGWWIALILVIGLMAFSVWVFRRFRTPTAFKTARHEFQGLRESFAASQQDLTLVLGLSRLLRRYAMAVYGREQVAGLTGHKWLAFLNEKGMTNQFTEGAGRVLVSAPYGSQESVQGKELLATVEQWLQGNRRPKP
jgi:Domain of unknown function (DUF4381)